MIETISRGGATGGTGADRKDASEPEEFKPWTQEEAQLWRTKNLPLSPWRVVAAQAAAGLVCAVAAGLVAQRAEAAWSALYGAAAIVIPGALLARGMTRGLGNNSGMAGVAVFRFMFWEMVKIGVAVTMLVAAPRMVPGLSWPALLVAMIVCAKMNWLALLWRRRPAVTEEPTQRV